MTINTTTQPTLNISSTMPLILGRNHVELSVSKASTSHGDQVLVYDKEHLSGRVDTTVQYFEEGSWVDWDKQALLAAYEPNTGEG